MGLHLGMRSSIRKNGLNYEQSKISKFDPNPTNFIIKDYKEKNGNLVILVHYPNCINYEGKKILFFKNTTWNVVKILTELDPHFTEESTIKPFARFEPTFEGWLCAVSLLDNI